ncbi:hypothetical protein HX012_02645 [Myroides marinus]|nr:hypothetical protein [Myroides marinus]
MKYTLNFSTSYNQFYIADKLYSGDTDSDNFWTDESYHDRLVMESGILGVSTQSYGLIQGEVFLLQEPVKEIDFSKYDHIVEAGISIESGVLQILDCPNSSVELEIKIKPGKYRVRVYGSNFSSVKENDLSNSTDNDFYKIEIWPQDNVGRKVLKQYIGK